MKLKLLFILVLVLLATSANSTVFFYWDAEGETCDAELVNPPFWTQDVDLRGYTACSTTPEGSKFIEWTTEQGWIDHYTEIHNTQSLPVTCSLGTTYYLAYFFNFSRIGGLDIWHEGTATQSADKGIEITGNGIRWEGSRGQWDSYVANDEDRFTMMLGNAVYHLNPELEHSDVYWQNQNGYSETNPIQLEYETWYSAVMGIKMASDHTGSAELWINGVKIIEYTSMQTANDGSPTITDIKIGGTIAQGPTPDGCDSDPEATSNPCGNDAPPHYRRFDSLILTDTWQDIVDGGYLSNPNPGSIIKKIMTFFRRLRG